MDSVESGGRASGATDGCSLNAGEDGTAAFATAVPHDVQNGAPVLMAPHDVQNLLMDYPLIEEELVSLMIV